MPKNMRTEEGWLQYMHDRNNARGEAIAAAAAAHRPSVGSSGAKDVAISIGDHDDVDIIRDAGRHYQPRPAGCESPVGIVRLGPQAPSEVEAPCGPTPERS